MCLTDSQIQSIRQVAGKQSRVRVFGSGLDDTAHGGYIDLMLELQEPVSVLRYSIPGECGAP